MHWSGSTRTCLYQKVISKTMAQLEKFLWLIFLPASVTRYLLVERLATHWPYLISITFSARLLARKWPETRSLVNFTEKCRFLWLCLFTYLYFLYQRKTRSNCISAKLFTTLCYKCLQNWAFYVKVEFCTVIVRSVFRNWRICLSSTMSARQTCTWTLSWLTNRFHAVLSHRPLQVSFGP